MSIECANTTMTFLFTDIVGSTRQWEELPAMADRVDHHFDVLYEAIERTGGAVFATLGDGVAAAFGSADSAVQAALIAQRAMPATGVTVRMGIHTGEVERVGDDFRGRPVNRAARINAVGHGGQILVSDVTAALLRSGPSRIELVDLGSHRLRDLTEAERLWQVVDPATGPQEFPPVRGIDTFSNNLPAQRSSLIGREHDVRNVTELLRDHRLVTLTGVGGVGKTRMVIQVAAELLSHFANVWYVELANVTDPDDVTDAIALALGARAVSDSLVAAVALLGGERTLLVIDNCEHVVDRAAEVIDALLVECPQLHVVTTSREALGIDGEHIISVRTLDPASTAVDLFVQRAAAAGADVRTFQRATIEHVCCRLDGIPLAIELAAARSATLGIGAIIDALDDRFSVLSSGRRRAVDRHSTMRSTIDWSYRLLPADEQSLFQWLAVFSNGFELDAARCVADALGLDEVAATDCIESLAHKSMIAPDAHAGIVRYRMLETVRAFALERLDEGGQRVAAMTAHAEWVATIAGLPADDPCTAAVERNSIRLDREADNWREAVTHALRLRSGELAARLCGPPTAFFLLGRNDLVDLVRPLVALCDDNRLWRRSVLTALVVASAGTSPGDELAQLAAEVQALDDDDPSGVGWLMRWLALAWQGDIPAAIDVCLDAIADERVPQSSRDMLTGIAVLDRFSLTDATDDPHGLIPRALDVAARSDVAIQRVTCLLGAAWGVADDSPDDALQFVRRALEDIDRVPALTRLTLPGSASRLLTRLDPQVAARGLLEQLDASQRRRSFIDFLPMFYASALLHRVGHPSAGSALATLSVSPVAPYLSMMNFVDIARHASASSGLCSLTEMEASIRLALVEISDGHFSLIGETAPVVRCA